MKRNFLVGVAAILVACLTPLRALATDSTLPKTRKKFKLHAVGIAFQAAGMTTSKRITRPADQKIGLLTMKQATLSANFEPPVAIPSTRLIWSGAATAQGPIVSVSFGSEGNRVVSLAVQDTRGDKNAFATIRVKFVSDITKAQLCTTSLALATMCTEAGLTAF